MSQNNTQNVHQRQVAIYFRPIYLYVALSVFLVEVLLATTYSSHRFLRGSLGDFLVVVLLYFFIRSFLRVPALPLAFALFLFACVVEGAQYLQLPRLLGLERTSILSIIIGNTFSWEDVLMYFLGALSALVLNRFVFKE